MRSLPQKERCNGIQCPNAALFHRPHADGRPRFAGARRLLADANLAIPHRARRRHPVLVLPGLLADDASTRALRGFLNAHGYKAHGWKQGRNYGLRGSLESEMRARLDEMFERHGRRKISLVGWSLGGLYARELATVAPDKVRCVISLGSPFAGSPRSTHAWRADEWASGNKDNEGVPPGLLGSLAEALAVPTTSIFSRTDGICAWQACLHAEGPLIENIEIDGSHCGLGHHPAAVYAIADRLAQPEGAWQKVDRGGWRAVVFPDWRRA